LRNKAFQHRTSGAGQLLSRSFVVLLRKSIPQSCNLKAAAELGVRQNEHMNNISFIFRESKESNDHEVRPIIDGLDILNIFSDTSLGLDPPDFFEQVALTKGGEILIGRCSCGVIGCGNTSIEVEVAEKSIFWSQPRSKKYEFEKSVYCLAISDAAKNTSWESLERTAERLVSNLNFSSKSENGYKFQWASARIKHGCITLSFEHEGTQRIFDIGWNNEDPEDARTQVLHWLIQNA